MLLCPWTSPGQNTAVGSLSLLQGIFPTQGSMPGLLPCRWILYHLSYPGSPPHHWDCSSSFKSLVKRARIGKRGNWMWTMKRGEWGGWLIRVSALSYNLKRYGAKSRSGNSLKPARALEVRSVYDITGVTADDGKCFSWCGMLQVKSKRKDGVKSKCPAGLRHAMNWLWVMMSSET